MVLIKNLKSCHPAVPCSAVTCPEAHQDVVNSARDATQSLGHQVMRRGKNGVFLTACPVHSLLTRPYFHWEEVGRPTLQRALSTWLQHREVRQGLGAKTPLVAAIETCVKHD